MSSYWYQGYKSPYYKETHHAFRAKLRAFVDKEVMPFVHEWDEAGTYPPELHDKAYKAGMCVSASILHYLLSALTSHHRDELTLLR